MQIEISNELMLAYTNFLTAADKEDFLFAGMMIRINPPALLAIGNVTEKGKDFANLLRKFADMLDEKTDKGLFKKPFFGDPD